MLGIPVFIFMSRANALCPRSGRVSGTYCLKEKIPSTKLESDDHISSAHVCFEFLAHHSVGLPNLDLAGICREK